MIFRSLTPKFGVESSPPKFGGHGFRRTEYKLKFSFLRGFCLLGRETSAQVATLICSFVASKFHLCFSPQLAFSFLVPSSSSSSSSSTPSLSYCFSYCLPDDLMSLVVLLSVAFVLLFGGFCCLYQNYATALHNARKLTNAQPTRLRNSRIPEHQKLIS